jgi:hypothetical protein
LRFKTDCNAPRDIANLQQDNSRHFPARPAKSRGRQAADSGSPSFCGGRDAAPLSEVKFTEPAVNRFSPTSSASVNRGGREYSVTLAFRPRPFTALTRAASVSGWCVGYFKRKASVEYPAGALFTHSMRHRTVPR